MNRTQIWIIATLMSVALIGLISFQLYWINNALKANKQRFKNNVFESMQQVANKLEKHQVAEQLGRIVKIEVDSSTIGWKNQWTESKDTIVLFSDNTERELPIHVSKHLKDNPESRFEYRIMAKAQAGSDSVQMIQLKKEAMVELVVSQMTTSQFRNRRPNQQLLDSLLHEELINNGIDISFEYVVLNRAEDSVVLTNFPNRKMKFDDFEFRTSLSPNDIWGNISYLSLNFPRQNQFLFRQIWATLTSSVVLLLIIIACFIYALQTIIRQKKLSDIKNDFINNMTHEFKTPVATISLANEALREPEVYTDKGKMFKYLNIIRDENQRLGTQVERVLQSASLDKGDYKLKFDRLNFKNVIEHALESVAITVSSRGGRIEFESDTDLFVEGDEHHLLNAINNLLDNAIKYSPEILHIKVVLADTGEQIQLSISDQGIGLSNDDQRKVFEKFYRVPTGNIHDVKGFGLGLSYVHTIVNLHGGKVQAKSTLGKGSTFIINIPKAI